LPDGPRRPLGFGERARYHLQAGGGWARLNGSPESKVSDQVQVERPQELGTAPQSARKEHGGVGRAGHITWAADPRNLPNRPGDRVTSAVKDSSTHPSWTQRCTAMLLTRAIMQHTH
jgi:hypothetical protein